MFQMRTSKPGPGNKYYIRTVSGGWNRAIQGKPTDKYCNVLSNCVGYANGRFAEIIGKNEVEYQLTCNAENFIERAIKYGLKISPTPTLGGIMVWQKGDTLEGKDGAGHVAIVERINNKNSVYTSESAYNGKAFFNATRTNDNGRWGISSKYKFRGCIVNPAVKETTTYKGTYPTLPSRGYFKSGDKGTQVKHLQSFLNWAIGSGLVVDGIIGPKTIAAVKKFQKAVGIKQDGLFGKNSLAKAKVYSK